MSKIIVLMGAPGAGKGTQARLLQERLNLPQVSTGDMFRALKEAHTPLAAEVRALMAAGQLVPDDVTIRVVRERTAQPDCRNGYILDGFPRTPAQAAMLEKLAAEQGKQIQAIEIQVPLELLAKRMVGRRNCPVCGEIYNIYGKPPRFDNVCDFHPEAQLLQRADDNANTVQARLTTYEEQTRPLLDYYKAAGLLHVVDGTGESEAIYNDIVATVSAHG
ncbi:MAG: adenylate kinase [Pyrinomonadaceae bacterium]|jgi:adenylate kinase|nr:adenylate kinase [Pyrinomonadaceae bacterium]MDQ1728572.1 adenylate kinase [Pyrinomonadaceae bacterium]